MTFTIGTAQAAEDDPQEIIVADVLRRPFSSNKHAHTRVLDGAALQQMPALRLDQILLSVQGASLFRRADSLTAHPTAQGLNLQPIGGNAAGRALVLLDGVPLNDPFGGWVNWSSLDVGSMDRVSLVRSGAIGVLGSQALTGTLMLESTEIQDIGGKVRLSYGNRNTKNVTVQMGFKSTKGYLSIAGHGFDTDGVHLLASEQRGAADVRAASDAYGVTLRAGYDIAPNTKLASTFRWFNEMRVNGIDGALNSTEGIDASLRLMLERDQMDHEVTVYYQYRDFENIFVAARDDRATTRPVLNQFDVPGRGFGATIRNIWAFDEGSLEFGADFQHKRGATNEQFRNLGAGFTRLRRAGGEQNLTGAYLHYRQEISGFAFSGNLRFNHYRTFNGSRREHDIALGTLLRDEDISDVSGSVLTGRLEAQKQIAGAFKLSGALYKTYRLPTINEYYRPFRVVNDITEANANLTHERLFGLEIRLHYQPLATVELSATYHRNWLKDGIGNVTIGFGPGFFPLGGFVPAGGSLRQRTNVDESITDALELDASVGFYDNFTLRFSYLYADARITKFAAMPALIGNRPVQTPRHTISSGLTWNGVKGHWFTLQARYISGQYDDDTNERWLSSALTVDAGLSVPVSDAISLRMDAENIFDAKVIAALSSSGLETLAKRRAFRASINLTF